ncbi:MAG: CDP-diacylglycerol--glycerol-3-phosphate 3-phosphatidyltransferase [Clostridia bacterium]|nr:CDP-diacylglycerol--glycerol-3-phosphate 3-phosphatidyltransferase [Clostridia bacterium]
MNTANKLTMLRMILIPVFVLCFYMSGYLWDLFAILAFAVASITDKLDGYIARKYNQITSFGKIMDPLADKLLVFSAFILMVNVGQIHAVAFLIILAREFTVTSMRAVAGGSGKVIAASMSGKLKTVCQMTCIIVILALPLFRAVGIDFLADYENIIANVLGWVAAAVTVWSGIDYAVKLVPVLKETK